MRAEIETIGVTTATLTERVLTCIKQLWTSLAVAFRYGIILVYPKGYGFV